MFSFRCYNKANGTLPLMHRVAPCQQDGLEMMPLGRISPQCHARPTSSTDQGDDTGQQKSDERREPSASSQHSCCLVGKSDGPASDDDSGEPAFSFFLQLRQSMVTVCENETAAVCLRLRASAKLLTSLPSQLRTSWTTCTRTGPCCAGTASACRTWTATRSRSGCPAAAWLGS